MSDPSTRMAIETAEAPGVVAAQLAANAGGWAELGRRLRDHPPAAVLTCARGSSGHALVYAKFLIETRLGRPVADLAPSIASVYKARLAIRGMLYLVASQSGRSPDLIASVEQAKADGALVVALVNDMESPIARLAEIAMPLMAAPEISVAATKSFIATLCAAAQMVAHWAGDAALIESLDRLSDRLAAARALDWSPAVPILAGAEHALVVGRGLGLAIAQEAALKLKETSMLHAEAFSAAELRHGPMEIVRPGLPALLFAQDDATRPGIEALARDLRAKGARVLVAGTAAVEDGERLPVPGDVHETLQPIVMAQSFYGLAEAVARARGRDPDHPRHLVKVTETH